MNLVLEELERTKFPTCTSRKNISDKGVEAFVLGEVNYRGQKSVNYKTRGPSRYNKKFSVLFDLLKEIIHIKHPDFEYTTIQVNKNVMCNPHVDKNNVGPSYGIAFGDFTGGNLVVEGKEHCIQNKFKKFDGRKGHWITPFKGIRYSIIYFTHTFKPPHPSLRNIIVKKDGLYNGDQLVKKYI
jgi:hypothetical protein